MIRSLLWKEWREHRWKMLVVSVLLLIAALVVHAFPYDMRDDRNLMALLAWALFAWLGAIWTAAFDISSDRAKGIERFLEALPRPGMAIFFIRTSVGLLSFLLPAVILYPWSAKVFIPGGVVAEPIFATTAYIYLILLAMLTGSRREGYIALVGVMVLVLIVMGGALLSVETQGWPSHAWFALLSPIVLFGRPREPVPADVMMGQILVCLLLWSMALSRFQRLASRGRSGVPEARAGRPAMVRSRRPGTSFAMPLLWKEWREQRGIVRQRGHVRPHGRDYRRHHRRPSAWNVESGGGIRHVFRIAYVHGDNHADHCRNYSRPKRIR